MGRLMTLARRRYPVLMMLPFCSQSCGPNVTGRGRHAPRDPGVRPHRSPSGEQMWLTSGGGWNLRCNSPALPTTGKPTTASDKPPQFPNPSYPQTDACNESTHARTIQIRSRGWYRCRTRCAADLPTTCA
ncbi:hypothetical protein B0T19DRAFT_227825 [Cercophora scortea]|uniref:Uncharacterized protein n=1 Tax=Cercophora scortea TaxID=314031 RepID=A0AAE0M9E1_9PEZI|nr:hypothetical protein B0T19DRAFT_227825 [Cercophora scortea]